MVPLQQPPPSATGLLQLRGVSAEAGSTTLQASVELLRDQALGWLPGPPRLGHLHAESAYRSPALLLEQELTALKSSVEDMRAHLQGLCLKAAAPAAAAAGDAELAEMRMALRQLQMQVAELHDLRLDDRQQVQGTLRGVETKLLNHISVQAIAVVSEEHGRLTTSLRAQLDELRGQVAELHGARPQLPEEHGQTSAALRAKLDELQGEVANLRSTRPQQLEENAPQTVALRLELEELRVDVDKLRSARPQEPGQLAEALAAQLEELRREVSELRGRPPHEAAELLDVHVAFRELREGQEVELEKLRQVVDSIRVEAQELLEKLAESGRQMAQAELGKLKKTTESLTAETADLREQTAHLGDIQHAQASMLEDLQGAAAKAELASLMAKRAQAGSDEVFGVGGLADSVRQLQEQHDELATALQVHQDMYLRDRLTSQRPSMSGSKVLGSEKSFTSSPGSQSQGNSRLLDGKASSLHLPADLRASEPLPIVPRQPASETAAGGTTVSPGGRLSTGSVPTPRGWGSILGGV